MPDITNNYVYVLLAHVGDQRIPLACFDSRQRCEYAAEHELEDELSEYGLRPTDCSNFVVEEWCVNAFLAGDAVKTLTSFDNRGNVDRRLVPSGMEGKTQSERKGLRIKKLLNNN